MHAEPTKPRPVSAFRSWHNHMRADHPKLWHPIRITIVVITVWWILFCLLLGIFAIGAPGVPGGTVMAYLGLITGVLMFDNAGTALMLAIFALQDSFGTACNVTGDGALTLMLTGYAEKHGIADTGDLESPIL